MKQHHKLNYINFLTLQAKVQLNISTTKVRLNYCYYLWVAQKLYVEFPPRGTERKFQANSNDGNPIGIS